MKLPKELFKTVNGIEHTISAPERSNGARATDATHRPVEIRAWRTVRIGWLWWRRTRSGCQVARVRSGPAFWSLWSVATASCIDDREEPIRIMISLAQGSLQVAMPMMWFVHKSDTSGVSFALFAASFGIYSGRWAGWQAW